jgi:hypothetical protein
MTTALINAWFLLSVAVLTWQLLSWLGPATSVFAP